MSVWIRDLFVKSKKRTDHSFGDARNSRSRNIAVYVRLLPNLSCLVAIIAHPHHVVAGHQTDAATAIVNTTHRAHGTHGDQARRVRVAHRFAISSSLPFHFSLSSVSSLLKLFGMAGLTTTLGTAEMTLLLAHITAKKVLPKQIQSTDRYRVKEDDDSKRYTIENVNQPHAVAAASSSANLIPPTSEPRQVVLDHRIARRLFYLARRLKQVWGRSLLQLYQLDCTFIDRNLGTPDALDRSKGPYLFVCLNQVSLLESAVLPVAPHFPTSFLMNWEFCLLPFLGWNLYLTGIAIDRANRESSQRGANQVIREMVEMKKSFYMSIEGKRSEDGRLNEFKRGAAYIAIAAQATIVPITTRGMREVLPFGDWRVRPGKIELTFQK